MPIRFRCGHCNQLMGIARRKAGMSVHCPTCHAQVVVPQPDAESPPPEPGRPPAPLFERSDFEEILQNPVADKPAPSVPPPPSPFAAMDIPSAPSFSATAGSVSSHPPGLLLSPTQATWLTVVVILLVALAFGAGLLVGHYWITG